MEEQAIKDLYKQYLENVLNIQYIKVSIQKESPLINSRVCLADKSRNPLTNYFDRIQELKNGMYFVGYNISSEIPECTFFDSDGNVIRKLEGFIVEEFKNDNDITKIFNSKNKRKCGYINFKGETLGEIKWGTLSGNFIDGRARVSSTEGSTLGKSGFIDEKGNLVIPCSSINFYDFSDGVVCADEGSLMKYYDRDGNLLFTDVLTSPFFKEGLVKYQNQDGKFGFKNKKGEIAIKAHFARVGDFNNGYAQVKDDVYIDLSGNKTKLVSYEYGSVKYEKGFLKNRYYNKVTGKYDKLSAVPFKDLGNYLLCVSNEEFVIYSKESGIYTSTKIKYQKNLLDIYVRNDILAICGNLFYLAPAGCINLSEVLDLNSVMSYEKCADIMDYESFKTKALKDEDFRKTIISSSEQIVSEQIQQNILRAKAKQDSERQELIDQLSSLYDHLNTLDNSAGKLAKIDPNILLKRVDDHLEIKEEFVNQLSYLDLSYIDFTNVKVSGIDFSGTNADLDPQQVYKKDMSNSNYQGMNFTSKNFSEVNIKGSSFIDCNMDFVIMDGAIKDDSTILGDTKVVK